MEAFYWIQIYKFAAASREGGPAVDLFGPWFRTSQWPGIWWNLNIQLTYWPVYAGNRLALGTTIWMSWTPISMNCWKNSKTPAHPR